MDDEKEIAKLLYSFVLSSIIGVSVGILRGIIQKANEDWKALLRAILASFLVAIFVGFGLEDFEFSTTIKIVITGISAFIADDILLGLMALGRVLGRDPFGFFARVMSAYKGQIRDEFMTKDSDKKGL